MAMVVAVALELAIVTVVPVAPELSKMGAHAVTRPTSGTRAYGPHVTRRWH
jgi:hypothetical protein